jgi:DNA-binding transcriptional ArsR family regulator
MKLKLEAVTKLIPYIKLVERERLRMRFDKAEKYDEYFASDEFNRLFDELVLDKLAVSEIMLFLQKEPLPAKEIAKGLGLTPVAVSRYLNSSSERGLVHFDEELKRYALA